MPRLRELTQPRQLLVEGKDIEGVFGELADASNLSDIQIQDFGGVAELRSFLKALRLSPAFASTVRSIGIVRDAETNAGDAFRSVSNALRDADLPVPTKPKEPSAADPRVTVLILPDCANPGMLEDLCLRAVASDPALVCVDAYIECIQERGIAVRNVSKSRAQTFLASRDRPGLTVGIAARVGYWPWTSAVFDDAREFLKRF